MYLLNPRVGAALGLVLGMGMLWRAFSAEMPAEKRQESVRSTALTATLGGIDRYLTYLSTDKPVYRPGETLYVRGVLLHHATRKPLPDEQPLDAVIEIKGPKGDTVASGISRAQDSVLGFQWVIPQSQAGGEYTIKTSYPHSGQPPAERKFDVRAYRAPRLKTQIRFLRDGYGPGDDVIAMLHVERAEGGAPTTSAVTSVARVDGVEVFRGRTAVDSKGNCQARFKLPAEIRRGEGTLAMIIEDGGVAETACKTIPILLQTVDLTVYPEGGDLIAGLANRVYFEAFTPARKPADLAGVVLDAAGNEVAKFHSQHEGRGRFSFTPAKDGRYVLAITEPPGIKTRYPLPDVKPSGVVLSSLDEVTPKGQAVRLSLAATSSDTYRVTLQQREAEVATAKMQVMAGGSTEIALWPGSADGVLTATVWNAASNPLAERLIFRQPAHSVQVKLTANSPQYVPGGIARISVQTSDETGKPISVLVGLTASDDSVLEMIDRREQAPRLPVMVLLEGDVKELADAHVYLDSANPKAGAAVDLLLGTQGWRRFAFLDPAKFSAAHGDTARRVLALKIPMEYTRFFSDRFDRDAEQFRKPAAAKPAANENRAVQIDAAAAPPKDAEKQAELAAKDEKVADGRELPADKKASRPSEAKSASESREREELRAALKRAGGGQGGKGLGIAADDLAESIRNDFIPVRIYAHQVRSSRQPGERTDFTETLFWSAGIRTDANGQATVQFGLNDAVTSFRVFADAFSQNGALGTSSLAIDSVEPFYLEPKLPLEVTSGDLIRLPIGLVNATSSPLGDGSLTYEVHNSARIDSGSATFSLPARQRVRQYVNLKVGQQVGEAQFVLQANAKPYSDKVTRSFKVRPQGFPAQIAFGGLVSPDSTISHDVSLPATAVPHSVAARVVVYPTPLASMNEALAALIREPYGCFEQTSSTVYPLVMAQQYFKSHQGVEPTLIEKSGQILKTGYDRLLGFESKSGGYEWFGADPGHDALSAYGLMEFTDMAQVHHVDPAMLERTRKWLLDQRDGKGGYVRKTHTLHTWIADPECANAYNTWALLDAGVKADLSTEIKAVRDAAEKSQNTYAVALAANVLALAGDKEGASHLLDKLAGKQQADGSLSGATTSVIGSGGEALAIETTSLAVLAWLQNSRYAEHVEKSIMYLAESCKAGRYGSTQATVLALRAIVAYDKSRTQPTVPGTLQLVVDGKEIGRGVPFDRQTSGAIELPTFAELLSPGKHQVQLRMSNGSQMPYSLAVNYHNLKPNSSDDCKVHLQVKLRDRQIDEGTVTEAGVVVVNRTNEAIPTPIAIVGIPGGLEVRHDQLKELVKAKKIDAYEVLGQEVVLYWRSLAQEARVDLSLSLIAAVPGTYTGPASRAYLYYTDEHKLWADGLKVTIEPKSP